MFQRFAMATGSVAMMKRGKKAEKEKKRRCYGDGTSGEVKVQQEQTHTPGCPCVYKREREKQTSRKRGNDFMLPFFLLFHSVWKSLNTPSGRFVMRSPSISAQQEKELQFQFGNSYKTQQQRTKLRITCVCRSVCVCDRV